MNKSLLSESLGPQSIKLKSRVKCDFCKDKPPSRLSSWALACDACSLAHHAQYNLNDTRLSDRSLLERFPANHIGAKKCTVCKGNNLIILYDEVDDEWLFCGDCRNFKQLLRCWNMYSNTMVNFLEKPIVRRSSALTEQEENALTSDFNTQSSGCDEEDATSDDAGPGTVVELEKNHAGRHNYDESDLAKLPDLIKITYDVNSGGLQKNRKSKVKKKRK